MAQQSCIPLSSMLGESLGSFAEELLLMLDRPEKTARLLAALKAAAPFEVEMGQELIDYLRAENLAETHQIRQTVYGLSYAGDEGGIMCHLSRSDETGRALVVSITHVQVPRSARIAWAVADYQTHRMKKLKKQGRSLDIRHFD